MPMHKVFFLQFFWFESVFHDSNSLILIFFHVFHDFDQFLMSILFFFRIMLGFLISILFSLDFVRLSYFNFIFL